MELLIVSGLSGAGKSVAMNALEDIGYFCIDNIPAALLPSITAFSKAGDNQLHLFAHEVERLEVAVHHANDAVGRDEEGQ